MIGRILRPADFENVLGAPQRSRSVHFAVHYLAGLPGRARAAIAATSSEPVIQGLSPDLSTEGVSMQASLVDECRHWLGLVVPKRHARRAVTRNLLKRQLRAAMVHHVSDLPCGMWVVRLRAPFDREHFLSPASEHLRETAHAEIEGLFLQAAHAPLPPRASGFKSRIKTARGGAAA